MKKHIYFCVFFLLFFSFCLNSVNAATLTRGAWNSDYDTYIPKKIDGTIAYCANHYYYAPPSGSKYYKNPDWDDSDVCEYKTNKNVDCSVMVGYIISVGKSLANKNNLGSTSKYLLVQKAIQSYLYKYSSGNWSFGNANFLNDNFGGVKVSKVISEAWKKYKAYQKNLSESNVNASGAENMEISISVAGDDKNLYYNTTEEAYYSYKITVTVSGVDRKNYDKLAIGLSTSGDNDEVRFCDNPDDGWGNCGKTVSEPKLNKKDFYLVSKKTKSFKVNAKVTYTDTKNSTISVSYKDSIMYDYSHKFYGRHFPQKFIILDPDNTTTVKKPVKKVSKKTSMNFSVVPIKKGNCSSLYRGYNDGANSSKSVICENNKKRGEVGNTSASFASCIEDTVSFSYSYKVDNVCKNSSASTNIVVGQKGYFNFGRLIGDTDPIIKGQGFYLNNTYYVNQVSWKNSLMYSSTGNVYYWLSNSGSVHHDTYVYAGNGCKGNPIKFDDYANQISSYKIANDIENGDNGLKNKTFKTYNNNSDSKSFVPVNINKTGSVAGSVSADIIQNVQYIFKAPNAYLKVKDSNVYYNIDGESKNNFLNNDLYVSGGQRYYTLLKYFGDTFPFVLDVSDLSTVNKIKWKLSGKCDIDLVKDCSDNCDDGSPTPNLYNCEKKNGVTSCDINYSYRSINVDDPFPKSVASNWSGYLDSSTGIKGRLSSTFDKKIYYSIDFANGDVSKITKYNDVDSYTSFNNLDSNGISSVISNSNGFEIIDNVGSYCKLGTFSTNCDN